jgi:hypothetical protein
MVLGPAITLMFIGGLGIAINLFQAVRWVVHPDKMEMEMQAEIDAMRAVFPNAAVPVQPGAMKFFAKFLVMLFLAVSVVNLLGGIRMLSLQSYWLAVLGSILAMVNISISFFCCCVGFPGGIWAFVVLMLPGVRDAFQ